MSLTTSVLPFDRNSQSTVSENHAVFPELLILSDLFLFFSFIEVFDESQLHAIHKADAKNGGTHFKVKIISNTFKGKSNIEKHRIVYGILDSELKNGVHALTLNLSDIE